MNMGGGILLRTVGRAAGSTTPAASTAFCSACTGQVARRSSLRTVCRACQNSTLSHQAAGTANPVELEDWEFADDFVSDNVNRSVFTQDSRLLFSPTSSVSSHTSVCDDSMPSDNQPWHIFGLPPSFEEAYAATSDLQAAISESKNFVTADDTKSTSSLSTPLEHEGPFLQALPSNKDSDSEQELQSSEWVEPQLFSSNSAMVQVVKSPVQEAFQLLQNDPNVKGAVISIVSDPDVWHAMMKNEKVQELRRIYEKSQEQGQTDTSSVQEQPSKDDAGDFLGGVSSVLRAIIEMSRQVICHVQDDLSRLVMSIFSLLTGTRCFAEKEQPIDKAMASTMMLAVLVVTVVLLKRVHI